MGYNKIFLKLIEKYLIVSDESKWDECNDFLIPIDVNLNPRT